MNFNEHSRLPGAHAFLSPSNNAWVNYDDDKLDARFVTAWAAQRGTEMHALANDLIRLGVKLPDIKKTLNLYVNDAIGFRMTPEQTLYYSINCFGTTDAIAFRNNFLRIHDFKNGVTKTSVTQLEVYAALFCLEYRYKPTELDGIELRIYQSNEARIYEGDIDAITHIMAKIIAFDKRIDALRMEALG
jgi:hypothetical protein